jgi:hypothetical protein
MTKGGQYTANLIKAPVQVMKCIVDHLKFITEILTDDKLKLVDEEDSYRLFGGCYPGCGPSDILLSKTLG